MSIPLTASIHKLNSEHMHDSEHKAKIVVGSFTLSAGTQEMAPHPLEISVEHTLSSEVRSHIYTGVRPQP